MVSHWIIYILTLLSAIAFRVAYTGWLAGIVLAFTALLPLLGLLVSLPAVLGTRAALTALQEEVERGEQGGWEVRLTSAPGLPLARVKGKVRLANLFTGESAGERVKLSLRGQRAGKELSQVQEQCGLMEGRLSSIWAVDCLGLFWLPLRREGRTARFLVLPPAAPAEELPRQAHPGVRPRPGGGPGEDYDPRDYRPGDPLNTVHWKLSAKRDELIVRETLEDMHITPVLLFDHFGPRRAVEEVLGRLRGLGEVLLSQGRPFAVAWAQPVTGELRRFEVADERGFRACLRAALAEPVPETGRSVLDGAAIPNAHFLASERGAEG